MKRINRGAIVIMASAMSVGSSVYAALTQPIAGTPWRLGSIERRIESQPVATGILEDRRGRVLARPVFDRSLERPSWVIERPFGAPLASAGLGRKLLLPYGIQGNLSGVMRTGAESMRPYQQPSPTMRWLLGDPMLIAPPIPTIRTTIDAPLSLAIYRRLAQAGVEKGSVVVLVPKTGEVIAMVDFPGPDVDAIELPNARVSLDSTAGNNLFASTMKTVSAAYILTRYPAAAMRAHDCDGTRCSARHGRVVNLEDALRQSCNTWFRLESSSWNRADWLKFILGLGVQPVDIPGLPFSPLVMTGHTEGVMYWPHAIGQQVWGSIVGLAAAYATITSADGRRVNPHVLLDGDLQRGRPQVVAPAVTETIRGMLWTTARLGTARPVNETYLQHDAGGKTGTGEVENAVSDSVFVGVAPWNAPQWIVAVSLKRGGSGGNAARLTGHILNDIRALDVSQLNQE